MSCVSERERDRYSNLSQEGGERDQRFKKQEKKNAVCYAWEGRKGVRESERACASGPGNAWGGIEKRERD